MGQIPGRTEESVDEGVDFWESPEHTVGDRLPGRAVLGDYSSRMGCEPVRLCHPLSSGRELGALLLGRGLFLHIEVYLSLKCCLNLNVPIVVYSRCSRGGGEQGTLRGTSTRAGLGVPAFWGSELSSCRAGTIVPQGLVNSLGRAREQEDNPSTLGSLGPPHQPPLLPLSASCPSSPAQRQPAPRRRQLLQVGPAPSSVQTSHSRWSETRGSLGPSPGRGRRRETTLN